MGLSRFLQTVLIYLNPSRFLHPDTRGFSQITSFIMTDFWLRSSFYRDTAPAHLIYSNNLTNSVHQPAVYRDTRTVHELCYLTAKTRAMVRSTAAFYSSCNNREILLPGLRSLTNTHIIIPPGRYA